MSKIKIFALGGLNENGKNMYVVEVDKNIFVFDCGLKYQTDRMLGVDYTIPNIDYLKENKKASYLIDKYAFLCYNIDKFKKNGRTKDEIN